MGLELAGTFHLSGGQIRRRSP